MTYKPPYTLTTKMVNLISEITEKLAHIEHDENKLITPYLRKKNRVKTLAGTLEIEGNFLGEEKITAMLDGKRVLGTVLEISEVEGAINCYKELENYQYDEVDSLLKAHEILMNGILKNAGTFRNTNVGVGNHIAPQSHLVPNLMIELFDWLKNSDEHPLIKSSVFHYEFEFIHPFVDGNGRMGRLWQTVILYNWKKVFNAIPTESVIRDNQQAYYDALEEAGKTGESTLFVEFMLEVLLKTIQEQVKQNSDVPKNVPKNVPINRLEQIFSLIEENGEITATQIAELLGVSDKTVKRDISKLKSNNRIKRVGSLKTGHWVCIK